MTGKEMVKLLQRHGFTLDRVTGSHHVMKKGSLSVPVPVHAGKDLGKGLQQLILKEAGLK